MSELSERIKSKERQAYLKAHESEYPFPLDGSNWARLIREKQFLEKHPHCRCDTCLNLLTRLHNKDSLLLRQRKMIMKAMHHWFLHDANLGGLFWADQLSAEELAKFKIAMQKHIGNKENESLESSEDDWLSHKVYSRPDHPEDETVRTWLHDSIDDSAKQKPDDSTEDWLYADPGTTQSAAEDSAIQALDFEI